MTVINQCLFVFTCVGLWRPLNWNGLKGRLYDLYTIFVFFINYSFFLFGFMDLDYKHIDFLGSIDLISLLLQFIENTPKIMCLLGDRYSVLNIANNLNFHPFDTKDNHEKIIQQKYDNFNRKLNLWFPILGCISITWYTISHISMMESPTLLPYRGRIPYNYSNNHRIYLLTAVDQIYSVLSLASINAAFNTLFPTLMYQICAKLNILKYRFKMTIKQLEISENSTKLSGEICNRTQARLIANWVECHIKLLNLFNSVNTLFATAIFIHYVVNSILLCTIAYILSHSPFGDIAFVSNIFFFVVKCSQQFLQCASAHQVTVEFENLRDVIFDTNWYTTKKAVQKSMIIIMSKTIVPVEFVSGYFVTLSLDSFMKIIKLSYTIYNVLE